MSSQDPAIASAPNNNDTTITIVSSNQQNTAPGASPPSASAAEPSNDELNHSTGSQRSLNSRLFPFRFSRDILLNNVSL